MSEFKGISLFPLIYAPLGVICFALGLFIYLKNKASVLNKLYFLFCLGISMWMIPISLANLYIFDDRINFNLVKIVFVSVVFLPTLALHFAVEYLGENVEKTVLRDLKIAYFFTFLFLILLWTTDLFIVGLNKYSWGIYPKGGPIHWLHAIFVIATALYMVHLLWHGMKLIKIKHGKIKKYHETKYVFIAFLFITMACTDFLQSWGLDIFPMGYFFVSVFFVSTAYAIFRHELLGISVVVKKSLIYSILISLMAAIYFSIVYIIGISIGNIAKAQSVPVILLILAVITLLFKPLEQKVQKLLDLWVFKKSRETIEKENELFHQQAQEQDRMKAVATLAAGMAHEIKNPLSAIRTFTEYLPAKAADPEFISKFTKVVGSEIEKIDLTVRQLLDFAKPSTPIMQRVDLQSILADTLDFLNADFLKNKIAVEKKFLSCPAYINGDVQQLRQAFLNIFINSIQAMCTGGTLTISTSVIINNRLLTAIKDTGLGISKENLNHVFDPFFTTKDTGTGLGLAIVHGIINKHGGMIDIKSDGKSYTEFLASFPIVAANMIHV